MAVKNRAALKAENAADFPDNTTGLISPADLRGQMDDTADSALLSEDIAGLDLSDAEVTSINHGTKTLAAWTEDITTGGGGMAGDFSPPWAGAITWPVTTRMQQQVYLLDFIPVAYHAAIRDGTAATVGHPNFFDCSNAMDAAIASISVPVAGVETSYEGGPEIVFPYGHCYFSRTIEINKTMTLTGYGQGLHSAYATRLTFAADITGITVNFVGTQNGDGYLAGVKGGNGTTIRHIYMRSLNSGARNPALNETGSGVGHGIGHGIWCRAQVNIEHVTVQWFPQHGLYVRAAAQNTPPPEMYGNANLSYVSHCSFVANGGSGMHIDGPDTNACTFIACNVSGNKLSGLRESSLIGNTHIGHHADGNAKDGTCSFATGPGPTDSNRYICVDETLAQTVPPAGGSVSTSVWEWIGNSNPGGGNPDLHADFPAWPYTTAGGTTPKIYRRGHPYYFDQASASLSVLINPYTEGNVPSFISPSTVVLGVCTYVQDPLGRGTFLRGLQMGHSMTIASKVGSAIAFDTSFSGNPNEAISWRANGDHVTGLSFNLHSTDKSWCYQWANSAGAVPLRFTNNLTTTLVGGRTSPIPSGNVVFGQGVWLGSSTIAVRKMTNGTVVPTTGEWAAGDIVFNSAPAVGEPLAWICVGAGTPGTWAMTSPLVAA